VADLLSVAGLVAVAAGAIWFAFVCVETLAWANVTLFMAMFVAGVILSLIGSYIGRFMFLIIGRPDRSVRITVIRRVGSMITGGLIGLIVGMPASLLLPICIYSYLTYSLHPERKYLGDAQQMGAGLSGILLVAAFGFLFGSGIVGKRVRNSGTR
jgi:hypothetical protein